MGVSPSCLAVFPNQEYDKEQLFLPTHDGYLKQGAGTGFQNQSHAHDGFVVVAGNGTHMFVDISDPFLPEVLQVVKSPYRTEDVADQHDQEQEGHTVSFAKYPDGKSYMVTIGGKGIDIWDVSDIASGVSHVISQDLPGINYGDVDGAIWGLAWQGNYIYVGATNNGLYVIDASDPLNLTDAVSPVSPDNYESVTNSNWNNIKVGPVFPLGNLLAFGTPKNGGGIVTLDISEPGKPLTLDTRSCGKNGYITWFYGQWMFCEEDIRIFDVVSDPSNIQHVVTAGGPPSEYMSFGDDHLFLGALRPEAGVFKYDISDINDPVLVGKVTNPASHHLEDDQFSIPIGNLIFVADDEHDRGSFVAVHATKPDTTPPRILYANPVNGASEMPLTTRIGVSFSDQIDLNSVNLNSFILRTAAHNGSPAGPALNGYFGINHTLVHFSPLKPLLPNTKYELLFPQGGISDLVGNGLDKQTSYEFTTTSIVEPSLEIVIEAEKGVLGDGVITSNDHAGASAGSYIDYPFGGGEAAYVLANTQSGSYDLSIRYANGSTTTRELRLNVESTDLIIEFAPTGAWNNWATVEVNNITLSETTVIKLVGTAVPGPNLDQIVLKGEPISPLLCQIDHTAIQVEQSALFAAPEQVGVSYLWQFGDGTSLNANGSVSKQYTEAGRYNVVLQVNDGQRIKQCSVTQIVHHPLTEGKPNTSRSLVINHQGSVWNVNPDNNSVSVHQQGSLTKDFEVKVGADPRALAVASDGNIWVVNFDSASISILDAADGSTIDTIELAYASQPVAIVFDPIGSTAYVSLQALGQIVAIDVESKSIVSTLHLNSVDDAIIPKVRGLAITADGTALLATRFVSGSDQGELYKIDTASFSLVKTISLAIDEGNGGELPDNTFNSRGKLNYINSVNIAPDGLEAWLSAKKDNIERGLLSDGRLPSFDSTTRTVLAAIDLNTASEQQNKRIDINDSDLVIATEYSHLGDLIFAAIQGNNEVKVFDRYSGELLTTITVGLAPQGLVLSDNGILYVHNFLSRSVSAINVNELLDGRGVNTALLAEVSLVENEVLTKQVLAGKKIFYDASNRDMSRDSYLSCATCHLDGAEDGQVFDFGHRGEGLRNTISLRGRSGTGHGPVHWTGNFDEIQDFENDIRAHFGGLGFMSEQAFNQGSISEPLGDKKAGVNSQLDALSAYVDSLNEVPASPFRQQDGSLTPEGGVGETIYSQLNCVTCHSGNTFTDSNSNKLHDVGTITVLSGKRINQALTGFDTPTLKGVWNTAPYLHDGSANTLMAVISNPLHGDASSLSDNDKETLVSYLRQLDESSNNVPGFGDSDSDNDGVADNDDQCANTIAGSPVDSLGCVIATEFPLQVEDYDRFFDDSTGNEGGDYRDDDVDIQATSDSAGGFNVGWIRAGEWLEYDISLPSGTYDISVRVASQQTGRIRISLSGDDMSAQSVEKNVASTGAWQKWSTLSLGRIVTGQANVLRIDMVDGPFNLNWPDVREVCTTSDCIDTDNDGVNDNIDVCPDTFAGLKVDEDGCALPITVLIQAEDFDRSFDLSTGNNGNGDTAGNVDTQMTSDSGGGLNVGWIRAGEWLEYDVSIVPGRYNVLARTASEMSGRISVSIDGDSVEADVLSSGGWQKWKNLDLGQIDVSEGSELRIDMLEGPFNLNWLELQPVKN